MSFKRTTACKPGLLANIVARCRKPVEEMRLSIYGKNLRESWLRPVEGLAMMCHWLGNPCPLALRALRCTSIRLFHGVWLFHVLLATTLLHGYQSMEWAETPINRTCLSIKPTTCLRVVVPVAQWLFRGSKGHVVFCEIDSAVGPFRAWFEIS